LSFETVSSPGVSPAVAYAVDTASGTINLHFQVGELKPGFPHPLVRERYAVVITAASPEGY